MPASLLLLVLLDPLPAQTGPTPYESQMEQWRRDREARLKSDDGWLSVAGLFWLKEGRNTAGSGPGNDIMLPADSAPSEVGVFDFHHGTTTFQSAAGVGATLNGRPASSGTLEPDSSGSPGILQVNSLTMFVIKRGNRYGIRLKNKNSPQRRTFTGLKYYPVREEYRVTGKFVAYDPPKLIPVPNILGETENEPSPGYVVFTLHGRECQLDPVTEGDTLFFIFKDLTSGKTTYPPGRFLNTAMPKDGKVVIDFNQAYNPPCAFTPYATCPLPPPENHLAVAIEAGELRYGH